MAEGDRQRLVALTYELRPLVVKLNEVLPSLLVLSSNVDAVRLVVRMVSPLVSALLVEHRADRITQTKLFTEHVNGLKEGRFGLSITDLERVREFMTRYYNFTTSSSRAVGQPQPGQLPQQQGQQPGQQQPQQQGGGSQKRGAAAPEPTTNGNDSFSQVVQRNPSLRVEDLRAPPVKQRRTNSTGSPNALGSSPAGAMVPDGMSPQTPATAMDITSPREGATPARGKSGRGRGRPRKDGKPPRPSKVNETSPLATNMVVDSPESINKKTPTASTSMAVPGPSTAPTPRDQDNAQIESDPNAYIEKLLGTANGSDGAVATTSAAGAPAGKMPNGLEQSLTGHLDFDFEPAVPTASAEASTSKAPLSFTNPFNVPSTMYPPTTATSVAPAAVTDALEAPPVDFDFFIDSHAAGFDIDDVETPELIAPGGRDEEASPPDSDETHQGALKARKAAFTSSTAPPTSTAASYAPTVGGFESALRPGRGFKDDLMLFDAEPGQSAPTSAADNVAADVPLGFSWDSELPPGQWSIMP